MTHVDRLASILVTGPIIGSGILSLSPAVPILMYHSVSDGAEPGVAPYYRLVTSPSRFREQMQWLRDGGYAVVPLNELVDRLMGGAHISRVVALTFDDGFHDFLQHAWPVLAEFQYSATVFVPTGYVDVNRKSFKGRNCLTWNEVRYLRTEGVSFGAHTVTHPVLHRLPWEAVVRELGDCRAHLEQELSEPVTTFAYPYAFPQEDGRFVERFRHELARAGFKAAVTTAIGRARVGHDPYCLKRLPVNDCDDRRLFMTKLVGGYDWLGRLQLLARKVRALGNH